jgi:hypothetical protein
MKYLKIILLATTASLSLTFNNCNADPGNINRYVELVYGEHSINALPSVKLDTISMFTMLENASDFVRCRALERVASHLDRATKKHINKKSKAQNHGENISLKEHQQHYVKYEFLQELNQQIESLRCNISGSRYLANTAIDAVWPKGSRKREINDLKQLIIKHIEFEIDEIFSNYKNTLKYFAAQHNVRHAGNVRVPHSAFNYLTKNPALSDKIRNIAHNIDEIASTQGLIVSLLNMAIDAAPDMIAQGIAQGGAMSATMIMSKEDMVKIKAKQAVLAAAQKTSSKNSKVVKKNAGALRDAAIATTKKHAKHVTSKDYADSQKAANANISYIKKGVSGYQDRRSYLINYPTQEACDYWKLSKAKCNQQQSDSNNNIVEADMLFAQGAIDTTGIEDAWYKSTGQQSEPWYSLYGSKLGNWLFNANNQQFIQTTKNHLLPDFATASQSNIFTEYVAPKRNYTIEQEVTIVDVSYPFFAGLMFNKGRHVSAVQIRTYQYRLFGLYGDNPKSGPEIKAVFAEDDTRKSNAEQSIPTLKKAVTLPVLATLNKELATTLKSDPLTFIFVVDNDQTMITLSLYQKVDGERKKLGSWTKAGLDSFLTLFHGVGFMSPGCISSWSLPKITIK